MSSNDLKPCPFCGGKPEFRRSGRQGHYIACNGCDSSSTLFTAAKDDVRQLLIETWNRRPTPDREAGRAEAHRHAVALRQCALFAADVGEHIVKAMVEAADFLDTAPPAIAVGDKAEVERDDWKSLHDAAQRKTQELAAGQKSLLDRATRAEAMCADLAGALEQIANDTEVHTKLNQERLCCKFQDIASSALAAYRKEASNGSL